MIFTKASATVKSLCHPKGNKFKKIRTDLIWQRQFVWNSEKSGLFLHTLMTNSFVYPILVADEEGSDLVSLLDGLQRVSVCRKFIAGDMKIDPNTPPVGDYDVARKTFKQLPAELQDAILDYSLDLVYVKGATEEELGDLFNRLNQSEPLTRVTLLRAVAGVEVASYLNQFETMDFFSKKALISPSARKTHGLTEMVLQSLSLFTMQNGSFSSKDLKKFALGMKNAPITAETTEAFKQTIQYLETAFPEVEAKEGEEPFEYDTLKKSALPLIVKSAEICMENAIDPLDFFDWTESFFSGKDKHGISFKANSSAGTSAKKNIRKRMSFMIESLLATFKDLEIPESCDFTIWDRQEAEAKAESERVKAEKKVVAQAKREATKAAKLAKEALKAEKANVVTATPAQDMDEESLAVEYAIDEALSGSDEDEEDSEPSTILEAIRQSKASDIPTTEEKDEALKAIFGTM